ncbi:hypothetical protein SPIROBIBN47_200026 [uncultured spirochete]|uniref:Uncharacterized protein n=1 Tax=uncultured spirochete TaxID=156406 RepID=A0A3P3XH60_9SPIR|nr:hypothetical protein SPIROBIBN47_200026 [uncultured spirochete]
MNIHTAGSSTSIQVKEMYIFYQRIFSILTLHQMD